VTHCYSYAKFRTFFMRHPV